MVWGSLVALLLAGWVLPFIAILLRLGGENNYVALTWLQLIVYVVGLILGVWGVIVAAKNQNWIFAGLGIIFSLVIIFMGISFVRYVPGIIPCTSIEAGTLKCPNTS